MPSLSSRSQFQAQNPRAKAHAALDSATNAQLQMTPGGVKIKKDQFANKTVAVLGSGVAGLTTAYELLKHECGAQVVVLEANNRTGGRCLSLRTGDTLTEDKDRELFGSSPGETQVVRFKRPLGDSEPYLNAGPGRIPSSHKRLLSYLKEFGVDIEVYVMNSESNLVQKDNAFGGQSVVYRQLDHNTRGWLAELVFNNAEHLVESVMTERFAAIDSLQERSRQLKMLMVDFGELTLVPEEGTEQDCNVDNCTAKYIVDAGEDGMENGKSRPGYSVLPGVDAGTTAEPITFNDLLKSEFWEGTRFYQPSDFLWQPTLFQPVGGMDRVQHAFAQQVAALGGTVKLNSPVSIIDWDESRQQFKIETAKVGTDETEVMYADYCFSNIAMPFLEKLLSDKLLSDKPDLGFNPLFSAGLKAVFKGQEGVELDGYEQRFLACTTKVGWQAQRSLWQGKNVGTTQDAVTCSSQDPEIGVVPIFGGISWTDDAIQQIWYPSTAYHDEKGVLTGAYNFGKTAHDWGCLSVQTRLDLARNGAKKFNTAFGEGLQEGLAIAWQNMPHIKGGWAQWHVVDNAVEHFNNLAQGTSVQNSDGTRTDKNFFVVGDQLSSLPGWQEGAIASAINAVNLAGNPAMSVAYLKALPDTRLMVEGV